jgi:hypothetical protein
MGVSPPDDRGGALPHCRRGRVTKNNQLVYIEERAETKHFSEKDRRHSSGHDQAQIRSKDLSRSSFQ